MKKIMKQSFPRQQKCNSAQKGYIGERKAEIINTGGRSREVQTILLVAQAPNPHVKGCEMHLRKPFGDLADGRSYLASRLLIWRAPRGGRKCAKPP